MSASSVNEKETGFDATANAASRSLAEQETLADEPPQPLKDIPVDPEKGVKAKREVGAWRHDEVQEIPHKYVYPSL